MIAVFWQQGATQAQPGADVPSAYSPTTPVYWYEVDSAAWQCGTQEPAANILKAKFTPDNSTGTIQVTVAKCDGSQFNTNGTIKVIFDDTREFKNWRYKTSTTSYMCGSDNRIAFRLLPASGDLALRGTARKCDQSAFTADGDMYVAADGNLIAGPDRYLQGNTSESITFTPLLLNTAGRHTYRAYLQSSNNAPGDYFISGAVTAWEEYHSYLTGEWSVSAGLQEFSFSFDPVSIGVTGWHPYQIHFYPSGQDYPIRSGIISAHEIAAPVGDQYEPDNDFSQAKPITTDGAVQTHTIHVAGDEDWVRFDAVAGNQYVIETLNLQGGADTYIGLFWDENNDNHADLILADDNSAGNLASRITWTSPRNGTHYVKVRDTVATKGGTSVAYGVKVTATAQAGDQYEPDNDFLQARPITTDGAVQTHTIHVAGDEDWVRFDAVAGYQYVIETLNLQGGADTLIGLFWDNNHDNHADLIKVDDNSNGGSASRVEWTSPRTDNHYVKIRDVYTGMGSTDAVYQIRVTARQVPEYNSAFLTDEQLENYQSMSVSQVRQFLIDHGSCFQSILTDSDGSSFDLAAEISVAATQYRINPQVLLTTLEKEQGLITRPSCPSYSQLRFLMGCLTQSTAHLQVHCAAERFRSYQDSLNNTGQTVSGWKVGVPKTTSDGVAVTPATKAVAGQFTYTPYAGVQWGGNQARWGGVYLFYQIWHSFGFDNAVIRRDVTPPSAQITAPDNLATINQDLIRIEVSAQDEAGGSGVQRVDFHAMYNGGSYYLGTDESIPFEFDWRIPRDLPSQQITLVPHAFDHSGNRSDLSQGHRIVNFIRSQVFPELGLEGWVAVSHRYYLNQRALGANGGLMCSMASIAMVRASAGLVNGNSLSLAEEAQRAWDAGLRGPGPRQVAEYLERNGMNARVNWNPDMDAQWQFITSEIDLNRPVMINSRPSIEGGTLTKSGHYIVAVGYQYGSSGGERSLIVYDPYGKWKGSVRMYDLNDTTHESMIGRWVAYPFDRLGVIVSIAASNQSGTLTAVNVAGLSDPDQIEMRNYEDIGEYDGQGESTSLYLPLLVR